MMRWHIVADVREFVYADAHVDDLGVYELVGLFKTPETDSPS